MKIEPIYPISNISNKNINKYILNIYSSYNPHFDDLLPNSDSKN